VPSPAFTPRVPGRGRGPSRAPNPNPLVPRLAPTSSAGVQVC
jgi:hypothetical protein